MDVNKLNLNNTKQNTTASEIGGKLEYAIGLILGQNKIRALKVDVFSNRKALVDGQNVKPFTILDRTTPLKDSSKSNVDFILAKNGTRIIIEAKNRFQNSDSSMITNGDIVKLVSDMETHKINYAILIYNKNRIIKPEQKMLLSLLKDNI